MKLTVQELANETTTGASGVSTVQGKVWLNEILKAAKKKMYFEQFAAVYDCPQGAKTLEVPVATTNKSFTSVSTSEANTRTLTVIDNLNTVSFTPVSYKMGASMSKDVLQTATVDTLAFVKDGIAYDAALKVDQAINTAIAAAAAPAATLYGGDATDTTTLAAGDILTTDLVAKAQRYLKANGWVSEPDKPFVLFLAATQEEAFLKDSQFVNAAEYGGNEIVMNGEVGKYLGIKVIQTEQVTSGATWGGGSLAGHAVYLIKAKVAYGVVYRERPTIDFEYKRDQAAYYIYLDMAFQAKTLQEGAIVIINVLDA